MTDKAPHLKRMIEERVELRERLAKLDAFIESDKFSELTQCERDLMMEQSNLMHSLSMLLLKRCMHGLMLHAISN